MDEFLKKFSARIRERRHEMKLSQMRAAEKIGIDYRHYQNIEGGKINMRLSTLMELSQFYKIRVTFSDLGGACEGGVKAN